MYKLLEFKVMVYVYYSLHRLLISPFVQIFINYFLLLQMNNNSQLKQRKKASWSMTNKYTQTIPHHA